MLKQHGDYSILLRASQQLLLVSEALDQDFLLLLSPFQNVVVPSVLEALLPQLVGPFDPQLIHAAIFRLPVDVACWLKNALKAVLALKQRVLHGTFALPAVEVIRGILLAATVEGALALVGV